MFTFWLQARDLALHGRVHFFFLFFVVVWTVWAAKAVAAGRYRSATGHRQLRGSVIVPVVDEPVEMFAEVLRRIAASPVDEIVVVINGPRNHALERLCKRFRPRVQWAWVAAPSKRKALALGLGRTSGDVVVLVDSDTLWTESTYDELMRPFADPRVGGATTHQRILDPGRHWLTRFADWLEDVRTLTSMPAMSVFGRVGCLPGRTIAFRRDALVAALPRFLGERFLGVHLEVSDDRALTNYTLMQGYRTVYQRSSVVYTDAPTSLRKFVRQQYRWARGSQYNTLRMLPWLVRHARFLAFCYLSDILIPFVLLAVVATSVIDAVTGHAAVPGLRESIGSWTAIGFACVLGFAVRHLSHLRRRPRDVLFLPALVLLLLLVMTPVRIIGFFRCAFDQSWGTRSGGYQGARARHILSYVPTLTGTLLLLVAVWGGLLVEQPHRALRWAAPGGTPLLTGLAVVGLAALTVGFFAGRVRGHERLAVQPMLVGPRHAASRNSAAARRDGVLRPVGRVSPPTARRARPVWLQGILGSTAAVPRAASRSVSA